MSKSWAYSRYLVMRYMVEQGLSKYRINQMLNHWNRPMRNRYYEAVCRDIERGL